MGSADERMEALDQMVRSMMHEPFYAARTHQCEFLRLGVATIAHAGSFADTGPLWNESRDVSLMFSGEDFRDASDVHALKSAGHEFDPDNASYLVHLYEDYGFEAFRRMNGWFSGVLIDRRAKKAILFNDRYGVNRIFICETKRGVFFASESKALLRVAPEARSFDVRSLGEFISCGCVMQGRSIFAGIAAIPGASAWEITPGGQISKGVYFSPSEWENLPLLGEEQFFERIRAEWMQVLPRYFAGSERVGLSLTGGVDSRMILAWTKHPPGQLPCYTWGGMYRDCNDVSLSRRLAQLARQPHQTILVGEEFLRAFPSLVEKAVQISDGTMDATGSIDLYVQRKARAIAPVRLGGVYGGEILRRLVMFKPVGLRRDLFGAELARAIDAAGATYQVERQGHRLSFSAFKQAPWHMTGKFAIERSQVTYRTPYFDNALVALSYQTPPALVDCNDVSLRLIAEGNPAFAGIGTDRALVHGSHSLARQLRHWWQEFTFKAEYAYDYGMPQSLARLDHRLAWLHLERLFLGRHKFHHFRVWYRDTLAPYVRQVLLDDRSLSRPYLQRRNVEALVHAHTTGRANYTLELHRLLAIELTQRLLLEAQ